MKLVNPHRIAKAPKDLNDQALKDLFKKAGYDVVIERGNMFDNLFIMVGDKKVGIAHQYNENYLTIQKTNSYSNKGAVQLPYEKEFVTKHVNKLKAFCDERAKEVSEDNIQNDAFEKSNRLAYTLNRDEELDAIAPEVAYVGEKSYIYKDVIIIKAVTKGATVCEIKIGAVDNQLNIYGAKDMIQGTTPDEYIKSLNDAKALIDKCNAIYLHVIRVYNESK